VDFVIRGFFVRIDAMSKLKARTSKRRNDMEGCGVRLRWLLNLRGEDRSIPYVEIIVAEVFFAILSSNTAERQFILACL
jgi:hypothetical protein